MDPASVGTYSSPPRSGKNAPNCGSPIQEWVSTSPTRACNRAARTLQARKLAFRVINFHSTVPHALDCYPTHSAYQEHPKCPEHSDRSGWVYAQRHSHPLCGWSLSIGHWIPIVGRRRFLAGLHRELLGTCHFRFPRRPSTLGYNYPITISSRLPLLSSSPYGSQARAS